MREMGYYVPGPNFGKAEYLVNGHGAEMVVPGFTPSWPPPDGKVYVCVVTNAAFEAAGIAYDKREFEDFARDEGGPPRPKTWLTLPVEVAVAVEPRVEAKLSRA